MINQRQQLPPAEGSNEEAWARVILSISEKRKHLIDGALKIREQELEMARIDVEKQFKDVQSKYEGLLAQMTTEMKTVITERKSLHKIKIKGFKKRKASTHYVSSK